MHSFFFPLTLYKVGMYECTNCVLLFINYKVIQNGVIFIKSTTSKYCIKTLLNVNYELELMEIYGQNVNQVLY